MLGPVSPFRGLLRGLYGRFKVFVIPFLLGGLILQERLRCLSGSRFNSGAISISPLISGLSAASLRALSAPSEWAISKILFRVNVLLRNQKIQSQRPGNAGTLGAACQNFTRRPPCLGAGSALYRARAAELHLHFIPAETDLAAA